ncbi:uncharacterized protein MELLADRAFT_106921 [Melampsora larici-populina 98AG31]|uniref:Uncharacterized protein n=1 Tax=Melampsora larici-populina (strain 98AG31 / pathotype 3-4-7) TaxID=747676 RepID=F4RN28_MELLP|nr:uncharacterized protein MELLADRAFT_106921 [Melampsora larici-populina 98AG31]EGG06289.1 hypothetical protein MELLADRAFT_106921 [Melampsora larici-populina 98AG31]
MSKQPDQLEAVPKPTGSDTSPSQQHPQQEPSSTTSSSHTTIPRKENNESSISPILAPNGLTKEVRNGARKSKDLSKDDEEENNRVKKTVRRFENNQVFKPRSFCIDDHYIVEDNRAVEGTL